MYVQSDILYIILNCIDFQYSYTIHVFVHAVCITLLIKTFICVLPCLAYTCMYYIKYQFPMPHYIKHDVGQISMNYRPDKQFCHVGHAVPYPRCYDGQTKSPTSLHKYITKTLHECVVHQCICTGRLEIRYIHRNSVVSVWAIYLSMG